MTPRSPLKAELASAAQDAVRQIAQAVNDAGKLIAQAATEARALVVANAAEAAKAAGVQSSMNMEDHNMLVSLNTKMEGLKEDIAELKNGTSSRIAQLEQEKVNTRDSYPVLYKPKVEECLADHETRIRSVETSVTRVMTYGSAGIILLGIIEFILQKVW